MKFSTGEQCNIFGDSSQVFPAKPCTKKMKSKMKAIALFLFLNILAAVPAAFAQTYDQLNTQLQFLNHYGKAYQRGSLAANVLGSEYFNEDWMPVDVRVKDTIFQFEAAKINLWTGTLDVLFQNFERSVAPSFFSYVEFTMNGVRRRFVPGSSFAYEDKPLPGFAEVLGDGPVRILVQHLIFVREPNSQAHIVGGYTSNRLLKDAQIYLYDEQKLTLIKRKKDLQEYYKRKGSALDKYFKEHNPDIKNPQDMQKLVETLSPRV